MSHDPLISTSNPSNAETPPPQNQGATETAGIARAASIIALGNIISRILGLVRETLKSHYFGAGGTVDAFNVASTVPRMLFQLLVGGMVDSSLVPVFSEYTEEEREELWGLVSVLLSFVVIVMTFFVLLVELFPTQVAYLLSSGSSPETLALTAKLLRLTAPAIIFLSLSGVLSGVLYALKRFSFPAFSAAVFNAGIAGGALLLHDKLDITSMAIGLLVGGMMQTGLQLIGLRDARFRFKLNFSHPGLKRVVLLYMPIALGLIVDILFSQPISYNLASRTGEGGISWMNYATYLQQLPQGLVATAISFAILPTLAAHAARERESGDRLPFNQTLARGIRLVMVLIIPASVGLFLLAHPTVSLLYEHGDFLAFDTMMTATALQLYLIGLPFAAVDLLLVFSFYARQDTLTPSLIGVGVVIIYLITALLLLPTLGLFSLMVAESFKMFLHTMISGTILFKRLGKQGMDGILRTLGITLIAAAMMGVAVYGTQIGIESIFSPTGSLYELSAVIIPGISGAVVYIALITLLGIEEIQLLWRMIKGRVVG